MHQVVALLPMKGHSERIPNKNIKPFAGRPLFYHILETLSRCRYISCIVVNTDSDKIAALAEEFSSRIIIHRRPPELCGDFVSMNAIIDYEIHQRPESFFLQTHSTNPLLRTATLEKAIEYFFDHQDRYDSLFSVTRLHTRLYWADGKPINHDPNELLRTQDLPPVFEDNSSFYIFSKEAFYSAGKRRIGRRPRMFEVPRLEAVDIDEPADFLIAEAIYHKIKATP